MAKRKPKRLTCRWCGDTIDASNPDRVSNWSHGHPSVCPYRQDHVPALNGVHVGDLWENRHTGTVERIIGIRLGGAGTYTDREPVFLMGLVWDRPEPQEGTLEAELVVERPSLAELEQMPVIKETNYIGGETMWFLAEHADPLTRPGDWPVPWETRTERGYTDRSVPSEWRCPGYQHPLEDEEDRDKAYWHAYHTVARSCIDWDLTNVLWQVDPDAEPTLIPGAAPGARRTVLCLECGKEIRGTDDHVAGPRHIECADDSGLLVIQADTYGEEDVPDEDLPPSLRSEQPKHEQEALF